MDVTPVRDFSPQEMFFSMTDHRGVITRTNSVFARISRYGPDALIGAPHNIVRSPQMPGGAFRLMWDVIQAGRPFAGYVQSAAADGAVYWVFATVTPVPGGYLSVRTAPCVGDVWRAVQGIYTSTLDQERRARAEGATRREAAELGRDAILAELARRGYSAYEDFMAHLLPVEVAERARLAHEARPVPAATTDGRLNAVRLAATQISDQASALLRQIQHFRALSDGLRNSAEDASTGALGLSRATVAARAASELVSATAPTVLSTARAMERGGAETHVALEQLASRLDLDLRLLRGLQIRIALAKLHADMAVSFVDDLADGGESRLGLDHLPDLCEALDATVRLLTQALDAHATSMGDIVATIEEISAGLGQFQDFLFMWRNLLIRHGVSTNVAGHLSPIDEQLRHGFTQVIALRGLARQCLAEARPYNSALLLAPLGHLAAAVNASIPSAS